MAVQQDTEPAPASDSETGIYGSDYAAIYHRAFSLHALASVRGVLRLLKPIRDQAGLVVELGCGSGLLARELIGAGHRVLATDASPAMLELARGYLADAGAGAVGISRLVLPADPIPEADAIVSVGHVLNYLPDEQAISDTLVAIAQAVRPGGLFAIDVTSLQFGQSRRNQLSTGRAGDDWAVITKAEMPSAARLVRDITTFVPNEDGSWRRSDERHSYVLVDVDRVPELLAAEGVEVTIASGFGREPLPEGLCVLIGRRVVR